jgi:hypothetical protein
MKTILMDKHSRLFIQRVIFVAKEEKVIKQDLIVSQPYFKYLPKIQTILMDKHSSFLSIGSFVAKEEKVI